MDPMGMDLGIAILFSDKRKMGSDPHNPFNQCKHVNPKKKWTDGWPASNLIAEKFILKKHVALPLNIDVDKNLSKPVDGAIPHLDSSNLCSMYIVLIRSLWFQPRGKYVCHVRSLSQINCKHLFETSNQHVTVLIPCNIMQHHNKNVQMTLHDKWNTPHSILSSHPWIDIQNLSGCGKSQTWCVLCLNLSLSRP